MVPWFSTEIRTLHDKKRNSEKQWRKSRKAGRPDHKQLNKVYKKYRNHLNKTIDEEKIRHYNKAITDCGNDSKKLFKTMMGLLSSKSDNPMPDNDTDIQETFADFFQRKIDNIRQNLADHPLYTPSHRDVPVLPAFTSISEESTHKLLTQSRATTSVVDPCPTSIIKDNVDLLCPVITKIVNLSLQSGTFPERWKTAAVIPLLKREGLDRIESNYRPVSNLPFIAKLIEKAALNQLESHTLDLVPVYQSAYRKHYSTETALVKLHHDILKEMERGRSTAFVGLDLSAAFDTVDHSVMMSVLSHRFGISGDVADWIKSYLSPRHFFVHCSGKSSSSRMIDYSVPQGSCLGPVLFTYYSSTLEQCVLKHNKSLCGYADDHGTYDSFKSGTPQEAQCVQSLSNCLVDIQTWMNENRLKMNTTKTEFICFGGIKQLQKCEIENIDVCGTPVPRSNQIRYLGTWFDEHLNFKHNISQQIRKSMINLRQIRSIRPYLTDAACKLLVYNLVITPLDYCNPLYYGLPNCDIKRLQKVQNAAAKLILGLRKYDSATGALQQLHWVPIRFRIRSKIAQLVFKCLHGLAPTYLSEMIHPKRPRTGLRSAQTSEANLLEIPFNKNKTFFDRSFAVSGPTIWNSLPGHIRSCSSLDSLKAELKTFYCAQAFGKAS